MTPGEADTLPPTLPPVALATLRRLEAEAVASVARSLETWWARPPVPAVARSSSTAGGVGGDVGGTSPRLATGDVGCSGVRASPRDARPAAPSPGRTRTVPRVGTGCGSDNPASRPRPPGRGVREPG